MGFVLLYLFCVGVYISLFVFILLIIVLSVFLRILNTPLVSSDSSYNIIVNLTIVYLSSIIFWPPYDDDVIVCTITKYNMMIFYCLDGCPDYICYITLYTQNSIKTGNRQLSYIRDDVSVARMLLHKLPILGFLYIIEYK